MLAIRQNYFSLIENSLGNKMFRNFWLLDGGKKKDVVNNGQFACAWYLSTIIYLTGLIDSPHLTVETTEKELIAAGWQKIKRIRKGAILIWEEKSSNSSTNRHIGFYWSKEMAISNSSKKGFPIQHHFTYGIKDKKPKRQIEAIYWHPALNN